jgi:hypothetical protein
MWMLNNKAITIMNALRMCLDEVIRNSRGFKILSNSNDYI